MKKIVLPITVCFVLLVGCVAPAVVQPTPEPEVVLPTEEEPILVWESIVVEFVIEEPVVEEPIVEEPVVDEPVDEGTTRVELRAERFANFLPNFPWDGWSESKEKAFRVTEGMALYIGDYHPHPSVVGLPEEIPSIGYPTNFEQLRYIRSTMGIILEWEKLTGRKWSDALELDPSWKEFRDQFPGHLRVNCRDIGGGIHLVGYNDIFLFEDDRNIEGLRNPTYQELLAFLAEDKTDEHPWEITHWVWSEENPGEKIYITEAEVEALKAKGDGNYYTAYNFACGDFALMLRENANRVGWRCAYVVLCWQAHYINAFETTDRGLVLVAAYSDMMMEPVRSPNDPYPIAFGEGEGATMLKPLGSGIVYLW